MPFSPDQSAILLIDDDVFVRETLADLLRRHNYHPSAFEKPPDNLLEFIPTHHIALAIIDLMLDNHDGLELVIRLRENFPNLPIIGMTGHRFNQQTDTLSLFMQAGATATIAKPFTPQEFLDLIDHTLDAFRSNS